MGLVEARYRYAGIPGVRIKPSYKSKVMSFMSVFEPPRIVTKTQNYFSKKLGLNPSQRTVNLRKQTLHQANMIFQRDFRRTVAIATFLTAGFAIVVTSFNLLSTIQCDGYFIGVNCITDPAAAGSQFADSSARK